MMTTMMHRATTTTTTPFEYPALCAITKRITAFICEVKMKEKKSAQKERSFPLQKRSSKNPLLGEEEEEEEEEEEGFFVTNARSTWYYVCGTFLFHLYRESRALVEE